MRIKRKNRNARKLAVMIEKHKTENLRNSNYYGGFHLCYETVSAEAVKNAKTGKPHIWVYGDGRKYSAGANTPDLATQRISDYRINPTATYGGWHREPYKVSGRR